jgi:hypothetical protein
MWHRILRIFHWHGAFFPVKEVKVSKTPISETPREGAPQEMNRGKYLLVASLSLVAALSVPVAAKVVYVDPSVPVSGDGTTPILAFKTITDAINDATTVDGDTLTLSPGTYAESDIPISKWVIIEGSGSGSSPVTNSIVDGTTTGGNDGFDLLVGGNSATERLVFRNLRVMSQPARGMAIEGAISFVTLENVVFDSNGTQGLMITDVAVASDFLLDSCTFTNNPEGMRVEGSLDDITFTGGSFEGNTIGFNAIQQAPPAAATALTNITLDQTSFLNNTNMGFHAEKLSDALFDQVTVQNCGSAGVATAGIDIDLKWEDYSNISFISPTIDNCGWGDVLLGGGLLIRAHDEIPDYTPRPATLDNVSIEGGSITNSSVNGLWIGTRNKANLTPTNVVVHHVEFDNNATNSLINETQTQIDARFNYWGDPSGPVALFLDPNYGLYFGGTGETIGLGISSTLAEVAYTPFWLSVGGNTAVYVDGDFTGFTGSDPTGDATFVGGDAVRTLEEGLKNVASGGTLILTDDTYPTAGIALASPLTLQGETQAGTIIVPSGEDSQDEDLTGGTVQNGIVISSNNVTVQNLTLDGQGNPGLTAGKNNFRTGIVTDSSVTSGLGGLMVQDVTVQNTFLRGISLTGQGTNWLVDTVTVDNVGSTSYIPGTGEGGFGIYTADGDGTIVDCQVTNADIGIGVAESMTVIETNQFSGGRIGIYLTTDDYDTELESDDPVLAVVMGNTISASETGIFAEKVADGTEIGVATSGDGNNIDVTSSGSAVGIGIRLTNPFGQAIIQNNQILGSGSDNGIWIYEVPDSLDRVLINNNTLVSSSGTSAFWYEGNGVLLTDEASYFGGTDAPVYASLRGNSIQGYANGINLSRRATSVAGGYIGNVIIGGSSASASNTISYCGNGITIYEDDAANNGGFLATASIDGNLSSIINCLVGIDVNGGSAAITNNSIYSNGVGIKVSGGGTISDLGNINFDDPTNNTSEPDGDQDNVIDLQMAADAGPVSISSGNAFAADRVAPFLGSGPAVAYFVDNQSTQYVDLTTGATFDGQAPGAMSLAELFITEDKMNHGVDVTGAGLVRLRAGNVYVTPSGNISNAALAASSGDIVNIADGTYVASNTTITKSVALVGESRDGVVIVPAGIDDKLDSVSAGAVQNGIIVQADNVFIRNLTIDGEGNNVALGEPLDANNFRTGVLQEYSSLYNATQVENCVITGCYRRGVQLGTFNSGVGVSVNNLVEFCAIDDIDLRQGVVLSGNGTIANNTISDLGKVASGSYLGTGIYTEGYDVSITGNDISDFSLAGIRHYPDRYSQADVIVISGNTIQTPKDLANGVYGLDLSGLCFGSQIGGPLPADGNTIDLVTADNTWDRVGMFITHSSEQIVGSVEVQNNSISVAGDGAGIWMLANTIPNSPVVLLDNTLTSTGSTTVTSGTGTGVYLFDDGSLVGSASGSGYATLAGNTIDGFLTGVYLDSTVNQPMAVTIGETTGNTISNGTYGILVRDIDGFTGAATVSAIISGNTATINGFSGAGILVDGTDAAIRDNTIYDNAVGVLVRSGGTASLDGNSFVGAISNVVDLKTEVTAGDIVVSASARNDFAGLTSFIEHLSAQDWDGTVNRFEVASGLTYPGAMSAAERITLQNKTFHQPDNAPSGLISFDYTLKPETWVDDDWAGELPGNPVTRPDGVDIIFGDTGFDKIADALVKTLRTGTVHVVDGTYTESNLLLDKPVTVLGQSRNNVIIAPATFDDRLDNTYGGTVQNGFILDSNNVTIDSLTIDGMGNILLSVSGNSNYRQAIVTAQTPSGPLDDVTLQNLFIKNIYRRGLNLTTQSVGWLIDQVEIDRVEETSFLDGTGQGGFGLFMVDIDGTISDCVIKNADVGMVLAHGEVTLTGNTVSKGRRGAWLTYSDYDGPAYDNSAIQNVGSFTFSLQFNETTLQPLSGFAENVSTSAIQFEQLLTSDVGGGRLNLIGAITDPANTSFNGDLFEIEFRNLGTPLTSSDGSGLPDSMILDNNDFVAAPHLIELDAGSTPIPHIFIRGNDSLPSTTNISYHVIGDALTPGSIFKVRATLNGITSNPIMADIKGNVFSGSQEAMSLNAVGDGIVIGGPDAVDSNIFTVIASTTNSATGLRAQYSQGQVLVENNQFLCDGNDNGIILFKNESAILPVVVRGNTIESLASFSLAVDESNGIWITDDGSYFGESDGACYGELTANTITGFHRGVSILRSGFEQTGGEILEIIIGGDTANVANDISSCGTGIYLYEVDGASNGGYRCRTSVNGNAAIFNNEDYGIWVDGAQTVIEKSVVRNNLNVGMRIDNEADVEFFDSCFFGNLSFSIVNNNSASKVVDTTNVYWGASDGPAPYGSGFSVLGDFNFISLGYFCGLYNSAITSAGGSFPIPAAFNDRYLLHSVNVPVLDNDGTLRLISPRDRHGVDNAVEVEIVGANILGSGSITVQYDRDTDMGLTEHEVDMRLHHWDGGAWIPDLSSAVNTGNNTVTGDFSQEGIYAVINIPGTTIEDWNLFN